jgi:hypothetical protein
MSIASVIDRSGFGDPTFREFCTETLIRRFRSDNTVQLVEENGDARISTILTRVQDQIAALQSGDVEGTRRITVSVDRVRVDLLSPPDATMDGGSAHGVTDLRHTEGRVTRAAVYLYDPTDVEVLAHELGHALGYLHARWAPAGHLMAPDHSRIGRDMRGLEVVR